MGDPYFFPIYKEAERLNVPICVHMFLGRYGSEATGTMRVDKFFYSHLFGHTFEQMIALTVVLGEGLLDRPSCALCFWNRAPVGCPTGFTDWTNTMKCWATRCRNSKQCRASCWNAGSYTFLARPMKRKSPRHRNHRR